MNKKKFIISGGGTGGHIYPAIAIVEAIKMIAPDSEFLFIGANGKMEMEKIPKAGYSIEGLWISGFQRKQLWKNILLPVKILFSTIKVWSIITRFKPDVVIGVGGYASAMAVKVAAMRSIPTLIHEQNSYAGKTNQILAKQAKKICVAYENMDRFFPKDKIILTGNPIRQDILNIDNKKEAALTYYGFSKDKKTVFITGGSLGARTLNESILLGLKTLDDNNIQVLWQVGKIYFDEFKNKVKDFKNIKVLDFVDRMDFAYALSDLVVARAGALTISELCVSKKAAILVPSPNVAEDHQTANAMALSEKFAAEMIKDIDARKKLVPAILNLIIDEQKLKYYEKNISKLAKSDASESIANECLKLINQ